MHPVVIMAYDKSPAITKAVAALEEAGLEVTVLNTKTAKLVQFLGALAGEDDEEETDAPAADEPPADEPPTDEPPAEEPAPEEEAPVEEAIVNDEKVIVEYVEGDQLVLRPSSIEGGRYGTKAEYALNESQFAFWSEKKEGEGLKTRVMLEHKGESHFTEVLLDRETANPPRLLVGRDWKRS